MVHKVPFIPYRLLLHTLLNRNSLDDSVIAKFAKCESWMSELSNEKLVIFEDK